MGRRTAAFPMPSWTRTISATDGAGDGAGASGGGGEAGAGGAAAGADGGGAAAAFYESFQSADLKTNPSVQRYKTPEELAGAYVNLEKRFGIDPARRVDLPADPNDADGMRAVYTKLGLPEKADGYGFKLDDKASDADKTMLADFAQAAHKAGMPPQFAKAAMEFWQGKVAAANASAEAAQTARVAEGTAALKTEFGQAYEPRLGEIQRLIATDAPKELAEALKGDGLLAYPNLAKFLSKVVERMAEPGAAGGLSGDGDTGARAMTPAQAQGAVRALEGDPIKGKALRERNHPQHKAVVEERQRLLAMANPAAA